MSEKTYIAIDLKSFYASVECVERGLDPLTTNLVVADASRTEKTICLAVSPSLKSYGIPGRERLFKVIEKVKEVNAQRRQKAPGGELTGSSWEHLKLKEHPELAVDYIVAPPRMALYIDYSSRIYHVYLRYISHEDIHVYSIDEVFMDVTDYISLYGMTARELAMTMILDVLEKTGITATVGIGTNLYLAKVAMDIRAKHQPADENGVRIAEFDEMSYRYYMWSHRPLTDFWRVGRGYAKKLESHGLYTMGDIARCSEGQPWEYHNEDLLYKLFGVNAELLIDHAWGWEPCTMADIKAYRPHSNSKGSSQVLQEPYTFKKARIIAYEMADQLALDLMAADLVTDQVFLMVGYDKVSYKGRKAVKRARGSAELGSYTYSSKKIINAITGIFDRVADPDMMVRRMSVVALHVIKESDVPEKEVQEQIDMFTDYVDVARQEQIEAAELEKESNMQRTMLKIKEKYGKNAIFRGLNLKEGANARMRNEQIGGHKA